MKPLSARALGMTEKIVQEIRVSAEQKLSPATLTLPKGFSWSTFFASMSAISRRIVRVAMYHCWWTVRNGATLTSRCFFRRNARNEDHPFLRCLRDTLTSVFFVSGRRCVSSSCLRKGRATDCWSSLLSSASRRALAKRWMSCGIPFDYLKYEL